MKKYLFIAIVVVSGALAAAPKSHASVAPSCTGSGQDCAYDHGTTYVKCKTC